MCDSQLRCSKESLNIVVIAKKMFHRGSIGAILKDGQRQQYSPSSASSASPSPRGGSSSASSRSRPHSSTSAQNKNLLSPQPQRGFRPRLSPLRNLQPVLSTRRALDRAELRQTPHFNEALSDESSGRSSAGDLRDASSGPDSGGSEDAHSPQQRRSSSPPVVESPDESPVLSGGAAHSGGSRSDGSGSPSPHRGVCRRGSPSPVRGEGPRRGYAFSSPSSLSDGEEPDDVDEDPGTEDERGSSSEGLDSEEEALQELDARLRANEARGGGGLCQDRELSSGMTKVQFSPTRRVVGGTGRAASSNGPAARRWLRTESRSGSSGRSRGSSGSEEGGPGSEGDTPSPTSSGEEGGCGEGGGGGGNWDWIRESRLYSEREEGAVDEFEDSPVLENERTSMEGRGSGSYRVEQRAEQRRAEQRTGEQRPAFSPPRDPFGAQHRPSTTGPSRSSPTDPLSEGVGRSCSARAVGGRSSPDAAFSLAGYHNVRPASSSVVQRVVPRHTHDHVIEKWRNRPIDSPSPEGRIREEDADCGPPPPLPIRAAPPARPSRPSVPSRSSDSRLSAGAVLAAARSSVEAELHLRQAPESSTAAVPAKLPAPLGGAGVPASFDQCSARSACSASTLCSTAVGGGPQSSRQPPDSVRSLRSLDDHSSLNASTALNASALNVSALNASALNASHALNSSVASNGCDLNVDGGTVGLGGTGSRISKLKLCVCAASAVNARERCRLVKEEGCFLKELAICKSREMRLNQNLAKIDAHKARMAEGRLDVGWWCALLRAYCRCVLEKCSGVQKF